MRRHVVAKLAVHAVLAVLCGLAVLRKEDCPVSGAQVLQNLKLVVLKYD